MIGKTPIVVNDSRGFFANRCVGRYIAEGNEMFLEGVPPAMIENPPRWPACRSARCRCRTRSRSISGSRS